MGMDLNTRKNMEEVEVFQIDGFPYDDELPGRESQPAKGAARKSFLSLLIYWFNELLWRRAFWKGSKKD